MRNISFSLTTSQFLDGTKDVTRRLGWERLKPGDVLRVVKKAMGLKKGEKVEVLGYIRVQDARQEPLSRLLAGDLTYGRQECRREGFPDLTPAQFIAFFCRTHTGCFPDREITRIEFKRVSASG